MHVNPAQTISVELFFFAFVPLVSGGNSLGHQLRHRQRAKVMKLIDKLLQGTSLPRLESPGSVAKSLSDLRSCFSFRLRVNRVRSSGMSKAHFIDVPTEQPSLLLCHEPHNGLPNGSAPPAYSVRSQSRS